MRPIIPLFLLSLIAACSNSGSSSYNPPSFDVQGHRGCRGLMPENSIPAFIMAVDLGVTTLELDVVISADAKVVLSHEPFLSAEICTDTAGREIPKSEELSWNLYNMKYEDIKRCDCGTRTPEKFPQQQSMNTYKPLLSEVISTVEQYTRENGLAAVQYNIETKSKSITDGVYHPEPVAFAGMLHDVIKEAGIEDRVIIQSFDPRTLMAIHDIAPDWKTALLVTNQLGYRHNLQRLDFTPTIFSPNDIFLTQNMIDFMHNEGISVIPWTVNKKERMEELIDMGVDGIITDYPDILLDLIASKTGKADE